MIPVYFLPEESWAPGIATAEVLEAGDEGGSKAKRIIEGIVVGMVGSHFKFPVAAVGITFITSLASITALGVGLIIRGYSGQVTGFDLGGTYIPQGFMIGAGAIALIQSIVSIVSSSRKNHEDTAKNKNCTVTDEKAKKTNCNVFWYSCSGSNPDRTSDRNSYRYVHR